MASTFLKISRIVVVGEVKGDSTFDEGDFLSLEHGISFHSGFVSKKEGNEIIVIKELCSQELSEALGRDITPVIECYFHNEESKEEDNDEPYQFEYLSSQRKPTDNEYQLLKDSDYCKGGDMKREELSVIDVTDDFKILIVNYAVLNVFGNKKTVEFNTEKYALKYGVIYKYHHDQDVDDVDVDISEIM